MSARPTIYLAGPDVFLPDAIEAVDRKKRLCAEYGFEGLHPFDNNINLDATSAPIDREIYRANTAMIRECDLAIVNLTPFRGPSADVGTVFELGMLVGLGKPVLGYTNDAMTLLERTQSLGLAHFDVPANVWRDNYNMTIEDFGNADNLMIANSLAEGGFPVVRCNVPLEKRYTDLVGFEECLRQAAQKWHVSQVSGHASVR